MNQESYLIKIIKKSPSGEIERTIKCPSGKISVIRARNDTLLDELCTSIIANTPPYELNFKDSKLHYDNVIFIGTIGQMSSYTDSALQSLIQKNPERLNLLSLDVSTKERLATTPLSELSKADTSIAYVLIGLFSEAKVVFAIDPFFNFEDSERESLATLLSEAALLFNLSVIVIGLSSRPECWIDNEAIIKIQLEYNRQATIGFGASSDIDMQKLRELAHAEGLSLSHTESDKKKGILRRAIMILSALGIGASLSLIFEFYRPDTTQTVLISSPLNQGKKPGVFNYPPEIQRGIEIALTHPLDLIKDAKKEIQPESKKQRSPADDNSPLGRFLASRMKQNN